MRIGVACFCISFPLLTGTPIDGALLNPPLYEWHKPVIFSAVRLHFVCPCLRLILLWQQGYNTLWLLLAYDFQTNGGHTKRHRPGLTSSRSRQQCSPPCLPHREGSEGDEDRVGEEGMQWQYRVLLVCILHTVTSGEMGKFPQVSEDVSNSNSRDAEVPDTPGSMICKKLMGMSHPGCVGCEIPTPDSYHSPYTARIPGYHPATLLPLLYKEIGLFIATKQGPRNIIQRKIE